MNKRIPLYHLINSLNSKEKLFIKKYIAENLNTSSRDNYLEFYKILLQAKNLTDENILNKLSENSLKDYYPEAKFYLKKLIVKALRVHYTIYPKRALNEDSFLVNIEKQKEIYIYFSKGLFKDAFHLCKKYVRDWEEKNDYAMLSFAYKKMHQIQLMTENSPKDKNKYFELYTKLNKSNTEKSKFYYLSLKIEQDLQKIEIVRTADEIKIFENYLNVALLNNQSSSDIYFWYVQILCYFNLLDFKKLKHCFEQIDLQLKTHSLKLDEAVNLLQLYSKLTYISVYLDDNSYYYKYEKKYLKLVSDSSFLTEVHRNMHKFNSKITKSLYLFKSKKFNKMLNETIPKLDIENYIFEGAIMNNYVDLLSARGKANFKLKNMDEAYDYFNFIIDHKKKLKAKAHLVCSCFFHIWLIRFTCNEYKILLSVTNRYKIFLRTIKNEFSIEKALFKFMYSVSNNYSNKNVTINIDKLLNKLLSFKNTIDIELVNRLDIIYYLKVLKNKASG